MKKLLIISASLLGLAACQTTSAQPDNAPNLKSVKASFETPVMASTGDSADDPAIYIGKNGKGFIAGTDKQSGLYIYNLDGSERDYMKIGTINNVDLREGFSYKGQDHVLLVASNDEINSITTLLYNPATDKFIQPDDFQIPTGTLSPYGICMGKSVNGTFHVGLTSKAGIYQQHIVSETDGKITAQKVREFSTGTKTEGCAFDDRTGNLYIAEEEGGLYQYPAAPSGKDDQVVIARAGEYGTMADLEGVAVYPSGENGGYLLMSSQGNNSYVAFKLPSHEFAGRFQIVDGVVDGVSTTDGIDVTATPTARFPQGFFVVQDDMDDSSASKRQKKQNFKVIDWRDIAAVLD